MLKCMGTLHYFVTIFTKVENFCDIVSVFLDDKVFPKGSTLKGKNLLLGEQILSF